MRIIVDAYGGDNAPEAVLRGCRMAADQWKCEIILTGDGEKLRARAAELGVSLEGMTIAEAPDVFPMEAEPTAIMKQYKDSSMARGLQMLAEGGGEALVSAGSTGALVVGGTLIVKRIKGVKRPAIGTVVPCKDGCFMMLDSGANHDCRPEMLRQFGLMGSVYMKRILGVPNPRVGLVNIGVEETKGTELQVEAYGLMKEAGYNFIGNVEAREVPLGGCDVAVCDGFTGNIILKTTEGIRVPQTALRVDTVTTTGENGEEITTRTTGVYTVVGRVARFKPVTVVYTGDGFSLVKAAAEKESLRLRPGEEIILTAKELSDGAVVR